MDICDCGHPPIVAKDGHLLFAHLRRNQDDLFAESSERTICPVCATKWEMDYMIEHGKTTLYLCKDRRTGQYRIQDWLGGFQSDVYSVSKGYHNIAGIQINCRFYGPDGYVWTARRVGHYTEVAHCKRTKTKATLDMSALVRLGFIRLFDFYLGPDPKPATEGTS